MAAGTNGSRRWPLVFYPGNAIVAYASFVLDSLVVLVVLYLSLICDLYDNSIVAYKTGTQQTVNLVLDTIHLAMKREKKRVAAQLHLHSDQGFQYTSQAYFSLTQEYGTTPSMSRRGNCYDNAMAENFFYILKTECIYLYKPASF